LPDHIVKHETSHQNLGRFSNDKDIEVESARPLSRDRWLTHEKSAAGDTLRPGERFVDRAAFDDLAHSEPATTLRRGQSVFHARFGRGVVENIESGAESAMVTATFPGFGRRKILSRYLVNG
jgi:hypothetical protein